MVTLLYGLGLTLTLLHALGLLARWPVALAVLAVMNVGAVVGSLDKRAAWTAGGLGAAAVVVWLLAGGAGDIAEVLKALEMHVVGIPTALPFVGAEASLILSVLCGAAAGFVTQRSAGPYPALVLLLLAVVLLWLFNLPGALWCLLPAVVASVALMLVGGHDMNVRRVLPLAMVTVLLSYGAVAVGGVSIPAFRDAADSLRQRIYDLFFFTGSREEFSLADVGYYPQGEGQMGGPAEPSKEPVMAVITPRKVYLRGVIRNEYNGRAWEDSTQAKRYLWEGPRFRELRDATFDENLPAFTDPAFSELMRNRRVIVRMLGGSASTLFLPQRVRSLSTEGSLIPYFNTGSEVFTTRNLEVGDVWEADAPPLVAGEGGVALLIAACEGETDPRWEEVRRDYLSLPEHYFTSTAEEYRQLEALVYEVVSRADGPYEAAMALQQHLRNSYEYTLDAPIQSPKQDFVSSFILFDKAGYCTHFASAMTIMCRIAGLPARYVEGFVATPDERGMAIVTGEQGHAWTEVYFEGFGWLTFDATPPSLDFVLAAPDEEPEQPQAGEETAQPTPTPSPTPVPTPTATPEPPQVTPTPESMPVQELTPTPAPQPEADNAPDATPPAGEQGGGSFDPGPALLILAIGLAAAALVGRILWMTPGMQARRQKTEFARWLVWAQAAHDALRQLGLERQPDETPMAFFARVDTTNRIPQVLSQLSGAESLMFYGHADPMPEETAQAKASYEVVRAQLTAVQRLRMTLGRAFTFRRSRDITVK